MRTLNSDRVKKYFADRARNVTPKSLQAFAQVYYVPASADLEVTGLCAAILPKAELSRAKRFSNQNDKALYHQRRAFRRNCAALATGSVQRLEEMEFAETENGRPHIPQLPEIWFSFSSCRLGFLGSWSSSHGMGVDIEDHAYNLKAIELAGDLFSKAENEAIEQVRGLARQKAFIQTWCLKEAALKSIGKGLPYGLDRFECNLWPSSEIRKAPKYFGGPAQFRAHMITKTDGCAALVIRSRCDRRQTDLGSEARVFEISENGT